MLLLLRMSQLKKKLAWAGGKDADPVCDSGIYCYGESRPACNTPIKIIIQIQCQCRHRRIRLAFVIINFFVL